MAKTLRQHYRAVIMEDADGHQFWAWNNIPKAQMQQTYSTAKKVLCEHLTFKQMQACRQWKRNAKTIFGLNLEKRGRDFPITSVQVRKQHT